MKLHWDLFCSVIDNYGDIGICWRIARELVAEHGQKVRLWVDDLDSFQHIWPGVSTELDVQFCEEVEIRHWVPNMPDVCPADVVVEAFACRVPDSFLQAMAVRSPTPVWINLEYFSAETWVQECHGQASPHPRFALTQYFFIPGLGQGTGGVPGGRGELAALLDFQNDCAAVRGYWTVLQLSAEDALHISLFAYENAAVSGLVSALAQSSQASVLLVPEGRVLAQLADCLDVQMLGAGASCQRGELEVRVLPFMPQDAYDRLLWAADINFVRGEDSFVRAQHAGKPMVWQPYVQDDGAHQNKLEAFLRVYANELTSDAKTALLAVWRGWNSGGTSPEIWQTWLAHMPEYREHALRWAAKLQTKPNLVEELLNFALVKLPAGKL